MRWTGSSRRYAKDSRTYTAREPEYCSCGVNIASSLSRSCCCRDVCREFLEGHQAEMDFLSSQQRETKRNSRLVRTERGKTLNMCERERERDWRWFDLFFIHVRWWWLCFQAFLYDLEKVNFAPQPSHTHICALICVHILYNMPINC